MGVKRSMVVGFGIFLVLLVVLPSVGAQTVEEYKLRKKSTVRFQATTPLFAFKGRVKTIDGRLSFAYDPILEIGSTVRLFVPVKSITTGIDARDRDFYHLMRSETFPRITFRATTVESTESTLEEVLGTSPESPRTDLSGSDRDEADSHPLVRTGLVRGIFEISGDTERIRVPVVLEPVNGSVRIRSRFTLNIRDFGLEPPSLYVMNVNPTVTIEVDLWLRRLQ